MNRQITFRQYKLTDIAIFTTLTCLCEALIVFASTRWFPEQLYTLSVTPAVTAIVLVRWGWPGGIPALAGALAFCLASGATVLQLLIYCIGNLAALGMLGFLRVFKWERLHEQVLLTLLYALLTALSMQAGRGLVALLLGYPLAACAGFVATDVLSALFAVLLLWIVRRLDGMLEEQKHYLRRIAEEQEKERQARMNDMW